MAFNRLAFVGLTIGTLAAAGGGAYLAVRQNQAAPAPFDGLVPQTLQESPGRPESARGVAASGQAVTESEGVITPDAPPRPASPASPAPYAAPVDSGASRSSRAGKAGRPAPSSPPVRPSASAPASAQSQPSPAVPAASSSPSAAPVSASSGSMWEARSPVQPSVPDYKEPEPPPPPAPEFIDLTVPPDAVLGLQVERTISSELARVEDRVDARVTRDVRVGDRIAIPAGSNVRGSVIEVDRGGKLKSKARLAIRFHTIVLADGTELGFKTDPVVREGQSPSGETSAKVGGAAIGGAILGAILGGGKGAAIGGAVGAGAGTAAAMANERNPATLAAGSTVTVRVQAPVTVTVQKE